MNKKLVTFLSASILATSALSFTTIKPVKADTTPTSQSQAAYKNLLSGDSGLGEAKNAFGFIGTGINNYESVAGGNSQHMYLPTATTEVFNLKLNADFSQGGTINLSPDYSYNQGSDIPLIINQVYAYDSATNSKKLIYSNDGQTLDQSDFTVNKSGTNYSITVPKDNTDSLIFTVSPLNSSENGSNFYQHPSYGVHVSAKSNDGYVDGSDYASDNGGFGILWGQFDYATPVELKTNQATINTGDNYSLADQVKNSSDYASSNWVLRDANGNTIKTPINQLKAGTYYATYYGSYQGVTTKYAWNTIQLTVKDKAPVKPVNPDNDGGSNGGSVVPDNSGSSANSSPDNSNSSSNASSDVPNTNTPDNSNSSSASSNTANKGQFKPYMVYATKATGLYKQYNFNKAGLIKWFKQAKRTNRPVFKVIGQKGKTYRVISFNKGSYKKVGYIKKASLTSLYYHSGNYWTNGLYVINQAGVNTYKKANLTGKVNHYKFGKKIMVNKLIKHGLTYRFETTNGYYLTANKKLVKLG